MGQSLLKPDGVQRCHLPYFVLICTVGASAYSCVCLHRPLCFCRVTVLHLPAGFPLTKLKGMRQWETWREEVWVGCLYKCIHSILSGGLRGMGKVPDMREVCDSAAKK